MPLFVPAQWITIENEALDLNMHVFIWKYGQDQTTSSHYLGVRSSSEEVNSLDYWANGPHYPIISSTLTIQGVVLF